VPALTVLGRPLFHLGGPGGDPDATPLVCLHGAGGSAAMWAQLHVAFRGERAVYALDLPGHGRSTPLDEPGTLAAYARVVETLLETAGLARAVLVGHSMGGAVAELVALDTPERVAGLVLVGTAARLRVAPDIFRLLREDPPAAVAHVCRLAYGPAAPPDLVARGIAEMLRVPPAVIEADFRACDGVDLRARVPAIGAPTVVVVGDADVMTPPRFAAELAELVPGAALSMVPGIGHMLPVEAAPRLVEEVQRLLVRV
jgi:pimeloyl-ACP methyl ester carboxylesterase